MRYKLLAYLSEKPDASQRELSAHLGVSVGKVNYCIRGLVARGLIKIRNFSKSSSKLQYAYFLTPKGIEEKVAVTYLFLRRRIEEHEQIAIEIQRLKQELSLKR
jgi:EPS-associated MarR family transcriptional regulator